MEFFFRISVQNSLICCSVHTYDQVLHLAIDLCASPVAVATTLSPVDLTSTTTAAAAAHALPEGRTDIGHQAPVRGAEMPISLPPKVRTPARTSSAPVSSPRSPASSATTAQSPAPASSGNGRKYPLKDLVRSYMVSVLLNVKYLFLSFRMFAC